MHQIEGEDVITLALSPEVNGRVLAARAHITYCRQCAQALAAFVNEQLSTEPERQPLWSWTEVGTLLIQFAQQAIEKFQTSPPLIPGLALRHGGGEVVYHYELVEDVEGFEVEINVERQDDKDICTVIVVVAQPGEDTVFKQAGVKVTLSWGEDISRTEETDALGEVIFEDIPLAALSSLMVEIEPQ